MRRLRKHGIMSQGIALLMWMMLALIPCGMKAGTFSFPEKDTCSISHADERWPVEGGVSFSPYLVDSLLSEILTKNYNLSDTVRSYRARLYVKGQYHVHSRNALIRFVPSMFRFYTGVSDYLTEAVGRIHYTAPDVYIMKMQAYTGTFRRNQAGLYNTLDYLNVNAYSQTLLPDRFLSPLNREYSGYYNYSLDTSACASGGLDTRLNVSPKNHGTQLVNSSFAVGDSTGVISELTFSGKSELVEFTARVKMGSEDLERFLPKRYDIHLVFRFMWNKIEADYTAEITYDSICTSSDCVAKESGQHKYDLTSVYGLRSDAAALSQDTTLIAALRPFPLTEEQRNIYQAYFSQKKGMENVASSKQKRSRAFWGNVGDALIGSRSLNLDDWGRFHFSPLLDLGMIGYSHSSGFSYKQQFNYQRFFEKGSWIRVRPRFGYNFTHKEFFWNADLDFYYAPERLGAFVFKVGNGNRIYNSRVVDELKQSKDSLINFSKLNLDYFKDTYMQVGNRIELCNGLQFKASLDMHWRKAVAPSHAVVIDDKFRMKDVVIQPSYVSFAPRIQLMWTPGLYYYMDDYRKTYLHSKYPTVSFDYERGIKGVLGSNSSYGRIEADVQQRIPLSRLSSLYYRYGGGLFTEQESVYFVDFANFNRSYLPIGWTDDISGSFHLLDNDWYNSSKWYARAHVTYESPFILLPRLNRLLGTVHSECLYLSVLGTTHLHPYVECGYGIRTFLFNAGVFGSIVNGRFNEVGCKFTFELFRGK